MTIRRKFRQRFWTLYNFKKNGFSNEELVRARYGGWFPLRQTGRSGRLSAKPCEKYIEKFARCDRLRDSPLFFFRRRLNGKKGKEYGARYREYREDGEVS